MKNYILLFLLIISAGNSYSQPVVCFNFVTHNEETNQWNGAPYYTANRAKLITLANYFKTNGITWNLQTDWVYLTNVITQETPPLMISTNNKNILRWLSEDQGVELDPHAHESKYIYPDVVKLMDSVGVAESKLMGGTIYNDSNGVNIWTNLSNGQYGIKFPTKFWKPNYMMGGGTPNHVADIKYYGLWNPQSPLSYLTHDTSQHLRHIGVGCEMKIRDTTTVAIFVASLREVLQNVKSGVYPNGGFYLQTIFFEQGDLNNATFYNKVIQVADSVNAMVATGKAQWKTLKQTYTQWETVYSAKMFQWECGKVATGVESSSSDKSIKVYPNPTSGKLFFELSGMNGFANAELRLYNVLGDLVHQSVLTNSTNEIDTRYLAKGMYFYQLKNNEVVISTGKIIKE